MRQGAALLEHQKPPCQLDHAAPDSRVTGSSQPFLATLLAATGGEPRQRPADRRSDKVDVALVNAHQADDVAVLGDCSDRGSDEGALEEEIERDRTEERYSECQQARRADVDAAALDDRQAHADVAELGAEQERGEALQKKQKSAGGKQLIDRRRAENGCLLSLQYDVHPFIGNTFGPLIFMICVLGGLGNMIGGFVAAFIISQIIAIGGYYYSTELSYVLAFTFFIVLMFVRPRGVLTR